ncbi:MAG: citramalate synthase [Candidatus Omnitrophica bacterium]|nr:citramalate synthase [Candidatus Omnitrophota bacterium]
MKRASRTRAADAIEIYDTTLRDGSQAEGVSYSVQDKLLIAERLDKLGVDYIEGGWPGSNPKDAAFFAKASKTRFKHAELVAFGSTCRARKNAARDANLRSLIDAGTRSVTLFGKCWDLHVRDVFKVALSENLRMVFDSVRFLKRSGKKVLFDAEHFFDGYRADPDYALDVCRAAIDGGATTVILCDTNGGSMPWEVSAAVSEFRRRFPEAGIGIHTHNDSGLAVANALAAVREGAIQVQGTINGQGERCGNLDLVTAAADLHFKMGKRVLAHDGLKRLTETSRFVYEISNQILQNQQPYVGSSAFAHKGGVHIDAVLKNARTYEHLVPEAVGNQRRLLTSELSGKTNIVMKASHFADRLSKESPKIRRIHRKIQELENEGYQFEAAEASLELLIRKVLKKTKPLFQLLDYKVVVVTKGGAAPTSEATIRLKVGKAEEHTAALGDGPVNALDSALRKALIPFYPKLASMRLSDFKVRVLDQKSGTAAKVRVFVVSQDHKGVWTTVGISTNLIEASWNALVDSIEYKILKR